MCRLLIASSTTRPCTRIRSWSGRGSRRHAGSGSTSATNKRRRLRGRHGCGAGWKYSTRTSHSPSGWRRTAFSLMAFTRRKFRGGSWSSSGPCTPPLFLLSARTCRSNCVLQRASGTPRRLDSGHAPATGRRRRLQIAFRGEERARLHRGPVADASGGQGVRLQEG